MYDCHFIFSLPPCLPIPSLPPSIHPSLLPSLFPSFPRTFFVPFFPLSFVPSFLFFFLPSFLSFLPSFLVSSFPLFLPTIILSKLFLFCWLVGWCVCLSIHFFLPSVLAFSLSLWMSFHSFNKHKSFLLSRHAVNKYKSWTIWSELLLQENLGTPPRAFCSIPTLPPLPACLPAYLSVSVCFPLCLSVSICISLTHLCLQFCYSSGKSYGKDKLQIETIEMPIISLLCFVSYHKHCFILFHIILSQLVCV